MKTNSLLKKEIELRRKLQGSIWVKNRLNTSSMETQKRVAEEVNKVDKKLRFFENMRKELQNEENMSKN